jgi:signal transduction histidine kinase/ligand-binding sensor domain-containing protein
MPPLAIAGMRSGHRASTGRRCKRAWWIFLSVLLSCTQLFGIDRDRRIDQLYHTTWTAKDGAPSAIHALAQTTDGYLWIGGGAGLFRFDGVHFQHYEPESGESLLRNDVVCLSADPDGGLWIGYRFEGVSFLKNGRVTNFSGRDGLPSGSVRAFARDRDGELWVGTLGGIARLDGSRWRRIGSDWNFEGAATTIFTDHAGTLWVGMRDRALFLPQGARRFQTAANRLLLASQFAEASDGTLWMAETARAVRPVPLRWKAGQLHPEVRVGSQAIMFDDRGSLWIATLGDGVRRVPYPERLGGRQIKQFGDAAESFTHRDGLSGDVVEALLQDREGNVWAGTNLGLDRFRQSALVPIPFSTGSHGFTFAAGDHGTVWVGTANRGLMGIRNGRAVVKRHDPNFTSLYEDHDGSLWMLGDGRLLHLAKGRVRESKAPEDFARAMTSDLSGRLWVSTLTKGVFRLEGHRWSSLVALGGPQDVALSASTDSTGRVWFGFTNNKIIAVDGDKLLTFSDRDGIGVGDVKSIESTGRHFWIGGDLGLALFDGIRFRQVLPADGTPFRGICGIVATADDGLWMSENRGITHIPEADIQAFRKDTRHRVSYRVFDFLDGLTSQLQKYARSAIEGADGHIWFATSEGVVWIDPKRIITNKLAPSISIESLYANDRTYTPSVNLRLPARTTDVQLTYTALSLSIPERVRFRYKLEGLDKEWQDVGTRREAFFTNLGPGSYRFHVIACNNDGVWNESGATLNFVITPTFYQTQWFVALCGLAVAGVVWCLYLLRLRQVTAQIHARLGERLVERERIARELHDTLLQGFQGLVLRFQAVMKQMPTDEPARKTMQSVLERADEVLVEGRQRVRDLREEVISDTELGNRLAKCGEELAQDHSARFSLLVVGTSQAVNPVVRDEVYRIGREALTNAFQHSHASKIEAEITYGHASVQLRVRDNGDGIDPTIRNDGKSGHWGLPGMRERAHNIGGQLRIWSDIGAGTEIELTIPAVVAYPRDSKGSPGRWIKRAIGGMKRGR